MELHLIKSVIEIERITLSIRFPGQLSCLIRNSNCSLIQISSMKNFLSFILSQMDNVLSEKVCLFN